MINSINTQTKATMAILTVQTMCIMPDSGTFLCVQCVVCVVVGRKRVAGGNTLKVQRYLKRFPSCLRLE